jgi:hypothetical protein
LKRRSSQYPSNEHISKRQHLSPRDDDNMTWVRHEIASIKATLAEIASEAREDRQNLISTLEELNFSGIKESLDELTYEAREDKDNLHSMLADILAEVQERE